MKKNYLLILLFIINLKAFSQPVVSFSPVISTGLTVPLDVVNAKDGSNKIFIVQQNGIIKIDSAGTLLSTPFLDVSSIITYDVGGERGLLSLAFHPNYAANRYFFIYYDNAAGNVTLAQYRALAGSPDKADPTSGKILMTIVKPFTNHNGCKLNFGPDGNLYFGTGDGGSGGDPNNNAQNGLSLLGKMIRINVDNFTTPPYHTVPADNPFVGSATVLDSIYALGLRNPWRWSFDRLTGDMWIADVGQSAWEEVNYRTPANMSAVNYGWRCYEGTHNYDLSQCGATPAVGKVSPIFEYAHNAAGGYVITGGYVYRGSEFPALQGYYICCDYATGNGWLIKPDGVGGWQVTEQNNFPTNIASYGEAEDGTLYAISLTGVLYKVIVTGTLPVNLISFNANYKDGRDLINWSATTDASLKNFEVERSADGTKFLHVADVSPQTITGSNSYQYTSVEIISGVRYYRLKINYANGSSKYSAVAKINGNSNTGIDVHYNGTKQLQLSLPSYLKQVNVINSNGQTVANYINLDAGTHTINMNNFAAGIYWLQCIGDKTENIKVIVP